MNIYVGNLSRNTTDGELRQVFEEFGRVDSVSIITDKLSGESRGFAFVEMPVQAEATAALTGVNGKDLGGRPLKVNEARPREDRGGGQRRGGGERRGPGGGGGRRGGY